MAVDLDKARANLPLPALLERLGHGAAAKKSARCPFHDDKAASFSVFHGTNGRWQWKCHAGTCGGGDEVDFIAKAEGIDNAAAIKRYGELAGANGRAPFSQPEYGPPATTADALKIFGGVVKSTEKALLAPKPPAVITPLTPEGVALLAQWRGYAPEFVQEVAAAGIVGTFDGHIAFPVTGGVHFRKKDSSWRYSEGASASLFKPWPLADGVDVHCFESQWDALAYADLSKERNVIATRGASNIAPLAQMLAGYDGGIIYLWPQRDAPGQKWAREIRNELALESVKLCVVPKEHKDLNDMLRALGKSCELEVDMAIASAKDFQPNEQCHTKIQQPKQQETEDTTKITEIHSSNISENTEQAMEAPSRTKTPPTTQPIERRLTSQSEDTDSQKKELPKSKNTDLGQAPESEQGPLVDHGTPEIKTELDDITSNEKKDTENSRLTPGESGANGFRTISASEAVKTAESDTPQPSTSIMLQEPRLNTLGQCEPQANQSSMLKSPSASSSVLTATESDTGQVGRILDLIVTFLKRYIVFPCKEQPEVIALWACHCWIYEAFRFSPYLHVCSPEKRCGKTRLLECIQLLVPRPRSFVRPSEAVLFRTIEKERPTLLLDEIDTIFGKDADESAEALRGILNAGFQKGGSVPRCEANGKSFTVVDFSVFSPKIIAGIGKIPDTVRDRSLEIRLVRQTNELKAARFRQVAAEEESAPIREALSAWAKAAANDLARACPELPEQLTDRQADMTEPLIAIADMAGGAWSEKGREAIIALCSVTEDQSPGVQLLKSIREIFAAKDRESLTSTDLINALISVEEANAPWVSWWETDVKRQQMHGPQQKLARMLEPYGIKPQKMGDDFDDNVKGYHRADFADAWQRYLSPVTGLITAELPF